MPCSPGGSASSARMDSSTRPKTSAIGNFFCVRHVKGVEAKEMRRGGWSSSSRVRGKHDPNRFPQYKY